VNGLLDKARFWIVAGIGVTVIAVDFTSWLMSAVTETVLIGAMLAVLWPSRK